MYVYILTIRVSLLGDVRWHWRELRHDEELIIVVGVRPQQIKENRKLSGPVFAGRYL